MISAPEGTRLAIQIETVIIIISSGLHSLGRPDSDRLRTFYNRRYSTKVAHGSSVPAYIESKMESRLYTLVNQVV